MRIFRSYASILILILLCITASGQKIFTSGHSNFNELTNDLNKIWKGKENQKHSGYKPFKRWEWFMKDRVKLTGELYNTSHVWNEFEFLNEVKSREVVSTNRNVNNWSSLGPNTSPGGYFGLGRINCMAFHPSDPAILYIGTAGGGIYKSATAGQSWTSLNSNLPTLPISDIVVDPNNPEIIYLASGDADGSGNYFGGYSFGVLKSVNGGASWNKTGLSFEYINNHFIYRLVVNPNNTSVLYAATNTGLYKTSNGGSSWQRLLEGEFCDLELHPANDKVVYATTLGSSQSYAKMYSSENEGATFKLLYEDPSVLRSNIAVSKARPNAVWVLTCNYIQGFNYVAYSADGNTFNVAMDDTSYNFLHHSEDGTGVGGQGTYDLAFAVNPQNALEYLIGGVNTWQVREGGSNISLANYWTSANLTQAQTVHADKHNIYYHPVNNYIYEVNDGGIYISKDSGKQWIDLTNGIDIGQIYRMDYSAGKLLAGHQDNGTKRLMDSGWKSVLGGDGMDNAINRMNINTQYGGVQNGVIYRTRNNWNDSKEVSHFFDSIGQQGNWVTPYVVHPKSNVVYAGYLDVFKSTNDGDTWIQLSFGGTSSLDQLAVSPEDDNIIFTSLGNVLYGTFNGGNTWKTLINNAPHNITSIRCKPDAKEVVAITLGGFEDGSKVYLSNDSGITWENISFDLPNVPVNTIELQKGSNGAIYIGNDFGVFKLNASLNSWELFSTNLPIVPVTDMVIDDSESKLYISTYGRGMWVSVIEPPSILEVTLTPVSFEGSGGQANLKITSNQKWKISYEDNHSDYDIFSIPEAIKNGEGNKEITLTVNKNTADIIREGTFTVSCVDCSDFKDISVSQKGRVIGVTPAFIKFRADPVETDTLQITYDGPWKAVYVPLNPDLPEYVILDNSAINLLNSGNGEESKIISSKVNDKYPIQLKGEIRFYSNDPSNPSTTPFGLVTVIQDPTRFTVFNLYSQNNFQYPDSNIIIPSNELEGIIYANTNANDFEYIINKMGFVKDVEESNIGNFIELKVILKNKNESKNGAKIDRHESIFIKYSDQNNKDKIISIAVNQPADSSGYLNVFPRSFTVRQNLENKIRVSSDLKWKITNSTNINIVGSDEGDGNEDVIFTINPNTLNKDVNSKITITAIDNSKVPPLEIERVISIKQPALRSTEEGKSIIFPSPSSGLITLCIADMENDCFYTIYNSKGKLVRNNTLMAANTVTIDLSDEASGVYILKVSNGDQINYYKFLIIK
ncbi:MAG: T9SS type A sorting domain-containing protein [Saprospiraceae bacterium]|nr:T9SS type A sorting domain-containing protein [Saprospiraceae bacterium]MBK7790942.1 T9SS type A sorting domain-containing protein [Saprospiraceae bacterium]MBK8849070.1 T9SS type A sorting domain-containing protein [Saprospiraceae bacterium]